MSRIEISGGRVSRFLMIEAISEVEAFLSAFRLLLEVKALLCSDLGSSFGEDGDRGRNDTPGWIA